MRTPARALVSATLTVALVALGGWVASAQQVSLTGSIYRYRGERENPVPLPNYRVFLRRSADGAWTGPILTDGLGRFAFYGLKSGPYLLKIYRTADNRSQVWQQEVAVPGHVKPIVLR